MAQELDLFTDSSGNHNLGFGGYFRNEWFAGTWDIGFVKRCKPSIEFLELYAIAIAIYLWAPQLMNSRVVLFTDNQMAKTILNNSSSSCKNCMNLVRKIISVQLKYKVSFFAEYVEGSKNE